MEQNVINQIERHIDGCIRQTEGIAELLRLFHTDYAYRRLANFSKELNSLMTEVVENQAELIQLGLLPDMSVLMSYLQQLETAQLNQDDILVADLLDCSFKPFFQELWLRFQQVWKFEPEDYLQKNLMALAKVDRPLCEKIIAYLENVPQPDRYILEESNGANKTLKVKDLEAEYYYYSNDNPIERVRSWVRSILKTDVQEYHVLGFGLGYTYIAVHAETKGLFPIHCYETDMELIVLAFTVFDYSGLLENDLILHYDPELKELAPKVKDSACQVLMYPPAIRNIVNPQVKQSYLKYFMAEISMKDQAVLLNGNFYKNRKEEIAGNVDALADRFAGKDVYIVAAGPSLDKNFMLLKNILAKREANAFLEGGGAAHNSVILAAGTVYYKLMSNGIRPDFVIISEANARVRGQIHHFVNEDIPLLLLSTSANALYRDYNGPKYVIYQQEFAPAEKAAKEEGRNLYMTGGSVSTTACDVAIRLGASRIIFVGLDLAFTDGYAHASDASRRDAGGTEGLMAIPGYDDKEVYADSKFLLYRDWFKRRLKMEDALQVEVIDATEGGALIPGMVIKKLSEVI